MKLNNADHRLISYSYHNSREPLTRIAKETRLSREQVDYKLKKYQENGLIKRFVGVFNWHKLGYKRNCILITKKEIDLKNSKKHIISEGKFVGNYESYHNLVFKDESEMTSWLSDQSLEEHIMLKPHFLELYPLKFISVKDPEKNFLFEGDTEKISKEEKEIIKLLDKDFRIKLVDIANKMNTSSELTLHRLRKLQKSKIILGSRIDFDMKKLGFDYTLLLMKINKSDTQTQNKIREFSRQNKNINSLMFTNENPNCIIQLFNKEKEDITITIKSLKELIPNQIANIEILFIDEDEYISSVPFL